MTTETTPTPKRAHVLREGSRQHFLVKHYNEGVTSIEKLAEMLRDEELSGKIKGLKRKDEAFLSTKNDLSFFKRCVTWYLNQAYNKGLVTTRIVKARTKKEVKEKVLSEKPELASSAGSDTVPTI